MHLNFIRAVYFAECGVRVKREGKESVIFVSKEYKIILEETIFDENIKSVKPYVPTVEDVLAEDWMVEVINPKFETGKILTGLMDNTLTVGDFLKSGKFNHINYGRQKGHTTVVSNFIENNPNLRFAIVTSIGDFNGNYERFPNTITINHLDGSNVDYIIIEDGNLPALEKLKSIREDISKVKLAVVS